MEYRNEGNEEWIIESILKKRQRKYNDPGISANSSLIYEYLIKWKDYDHSFNSWQTEDELFDMGISDYKEFLKRYDKKSYPLPKKDQNFKDKYSYIQTKKGERRVKNTKNPTKKVIETNYSSQIMCTPLTDFGPPPKYIKNSILEDFEIDNDINFDLNAPIDTIKGIGNRSAIKIASTLKIRNKLGDISNVYLGNPTLVETVLRQYIFSDFEDIFFKIRCAAKYLENHGRFFSLPVIGTLQQFNSLVLQNIPIFNDIFSIIINNNPKLGLMINKYYRYYVLSNKDFYDILPQKCIYCGKIFNQNTKNIHILPNPIWKLTPRFTKEPLNDNSIEFNVFFFNVSSIKWKKIITSCSEVSESLPIYTDYEIDSYVGKFWIGVTLPTITYDFTHYDFWMLQKFFGATDYAVNFYSYYTKRTIRVFLKVSRERIVNQLIRENSKVLFLNK